MKKQMLLSVLLLAIFAVGIVAVAVPVKAAWGDVTVVIETPDIVVPGGGIYLYIEGFPVDATGTTYFWLGEEPDEEVMSGDIQIAKWAASDVEEELLDTGGYITVYVPTTGVPAYDEYYVKVSASRSLEAAASVSAETIEVITEDLPTITVDPTSGKVGKLVDVSGADIASDYWGEYAELYWHTYYVDWAISDDPVEYGEFTATDVEIPTDLYTTMGAHKILVLLYDGTYYLGTFVEFEVEPSLDVVDLPDTYSIEEGVKDQWAEVGLHGFPKGTIKANTVDFVIRDIETGAEIESLGSTHDEEKIEKHGNLTSIYCYDVDGPSAGTVDLEFTVGTTKVVIEDAFVSSSAGESGDLLGKMDVTEGFTGDDVTFSAIWLPADSEVDIHFDGVEDIWLEDDLGLLSLYGDPFADGNGGWTCTITLEDLPGGEYTVSLKEFTYRKTYKIGKFIVLPEVVFRDSATDKKITSAHVDDEVYVEGTAFPPLASFRYITIGTGKEDMERYITVEDDYTWVSDDFFVPHTSGGGKEVAVVIKGKDADGKAISVEGKITIKPIVGEGYIEYYDDEGSLCQYLDYDEGGLDWGWMPYTEGETIFPGHPMNITGWGFLAGESVSVKFVDPATGDVVGTAEITDGGKADSDGDLEVIFNVPEGKKFKFGDTWDIHVVGTTKTNKYIVEDVETADRSDADAKIFFNLQPDGELDTTVNVGDEVPIVGVGFYTKSLTLQIAGEEIKDVTASDYGTFKTTLTIPKLVRDDDYSVEETETGRESVWFEIVSAVALSPERAIAGTEVTAAGTGFAEDETVDVYWPGIADYMVEVDADADGVFTAKFKVPTDPPGTYTITFDADELPDEDDPTATFYLLGPLKIVSLTMPGTVYPESTMTISVNVQDYFGSAVAGAKVTGKITPPVGTAITLTFPATDAAGMSSATWAVPADAAEGTYLVDITAEKAEAGGKATSSGSFYVEIKVPPTPPVDISKLEKSVSDLSTSVTGLSGDLSKLATDVSGLKSDIAALEAAIAAIPIVPVEWIYITAIMAIIAAIAAIAAVVAVYRKIA